MAPSAASGYRRAMSFIRRAILGAGAAEVFAVYLLVGVPNVAERPSALPATFVFAALGVLPFIVALRFPRIDWLACVVGLAMQATNVYFHVAFARDTHSTRGLLLMEAIFVSCALLGIGVGVGFEIQRRLHRRPNLTGAGLPRRR